MRKEYSRLRKNSKKTAMTRKKLSAPMRYLLDNGFFPRGRLSWSPESEWVTGTPLRFLDYGCGKGFDADFCGFHKYDPHFEGVDSLLPHNHYDIITCNYVLNTLPTMTDVHSVIWDIQAHLKEDGVAYISVRNDKKNLNGETKIGTWQQYVSLDAPIVHKTSSYVIYEITYQDTLTDILGVKLQWK